MTIFGFVTLIGILLVVYQLKHLLADYVFQGEYMLGKFKPGWEFLKPLLAHVAVHGGFTFAIALVMFLGFGVPCPGIFAAAIATFDMTIHFFMDRLKAGPKYMGRWKPLSAKEWMFWKGASTALPLDTYEGADGMPKLYTYEDFLAAPGKLRGNRLFWICLGFDQAIHHLTHYICIAAILACVVASL